VSVLWFCGKDSAASHIDCLWESSADSHPCRSILCNRKHSCQSTRGTADLLGHSAADMHDRDINNPIAPMFSSVPWKLPTASPVLHLPLSRRWLGAPVVTMAQS
jgi:hypothetical protein